MKPTLSLPAIALLLSAGSAFAADAIVKTRCEAAGKQAAIVVDASGAGRVQVGEGEEGYGCNLGLDAIEGPPFTDNASGMLVLELARKDCTPASRTREVQRDVFLHIADAQSPSREAMAVIERRVAVFQCKVEQLDMGALGKLQVQLTGGQGQGGN